MMYAVTANRQSFDRAVAWLEWLKTNSINSTYAWLGSSPSNKIDMVEQRRGLAVKYAASSLVKCERNGVVDETVRYMLRTDGAHDRPHIASIIR